MRIGVGLTNRRFTVCKTLLLQKLPGPCPKEWHLQSNRSFSHPFSFTYIACVLFPSHMWTPSCPIVLFIPNSIIAPKNRHIPQKPRFHAYLSHRWGRSNLNSTCSKNPSLSARTCQVNGVLEGQFITIKSEVSLSHPTNVKYSQLSHWDEEDYKEVQEKLAFKDILWQSSGAIATEQKNRLLGCNHQHHLLSQMDDGSIPCELNHFSWVLELPKSPSSSLYLGQASKLWQGELFPVIGSCNRSNDSTRCAGLRHSEPQS